MFDKANFGVPQFYPRDLKKRVDEYVVGQDRAKKTICSTIFNHYQNIRRRHKHEHEDMNIKERLTRHKFAREREMQQRRKETMHSGEGQHGRRSVDGRRYVADVFAEDEFPGHGESVHGFHDAAETQTHDEEPMEHLYVPDDPSVLEHVKIDKSNLLLIGPTGVGKTYILE